MATKRHKGNRTQHRPTTHYEPLISFEYNLQKERDKKAWQANSEQLPDDAFADNAVPDADDTKGVVRHNSYIVETSLSHYE